MEKAALTAMFDGMAESYDQQAARIAGVKDCLHALMQGALAGLPERARILCVGAGTGAEIIYLASRFPRWTFMAVDPSPGMLEVCRRRIGELNLQDRCEFHAGYLESLPPSAPFDAATSILVSQFILDKQTRIDFFSLIAGRLKPGGMLVSTDLTGDLDAANDQSVLETWLAALEAGGTPPEGLERMRNAYREDVAILPEREVADIIASGGFADPVHFYQAGLIHAWYSRRLPAQA